MPGLAGPSLQTTAIRRSTAQSRLHIGRPNGLNAGFTTMSINSVYIYNNCFVILSTDKTSHCCACVAMVNSFAISCGL